MVTTGLEPEVLEALQCIKTNKNFILEGGAGSGKTYSLISLINVLMKESPNVNIICITYTNNAVAEILSRIENDRLLVSTIHKFIWSLISKYQREIKEILVELINDKNDKKEKIFKKPKDFSGTLISIDYFKNLYVDYDEYYSITPENDCRISISHDHILMIAEKMFERYKKISDILKDLADCIFIDEYQDTSPLVAKILLTHLSQSCKKNVIGFFGDSMQSIYDDAVGDLSQYDLVKIIKKQNRRNPKSIIELANKFRNDIQQIPSEDVNAPNMESGVIREGTIKFLYGKELHIINIRGKSLFKSWDFSDGSQTKELRLTHKYNAEMSEFKDLYDLYHDDLIIKLIKQINDKVDSENLDKDETLGNLVARIEPTFKKQKLLDLVDDSRVYKSLYNDLKDMPWKEVFKKCRIAEQSLMSYKLNGLSRKYESNSYRDRILRRLDILSELIELYESNKINDFLRITKFSIGSTNDKIHLKETMDYLVNEEDKTIGDVLLFAEGKGLLKNDELYSSYILNKGYYLWKRIQEIPFKQYRKSIAYLKEFSPICTQHSVKGSEYDNVLLILESNWSKYDFNTLFGKGSSSTKVQQRTKKLFYVCITRAKKNLVIYMPTDDLEIVSKAKNIFGEEYVIDVSLLE